MTRSLATIKEYGAPTLSILKRVFMRYRALYVSPDGGIFHYFWASAISDYRFRKDTIDLALSFIEEEVYEI